MKPGFKNWLAARNYQPAVVGSRWANCQRVEQYYGNLDRAYGNDRLASILAVLIYSMEDQRRGRPNPSRIPIKGNFREGLATLRQALGLYVDFRNEESAPSSTPRRPMPPRPQAG